MIVKETINNAYTYVASELFRGWGTQKIEHLRFQPEVTCLRRYIREEVSKEENIIMAAIPTSPRNAKAKHVAGLI